jgi:hypothetical protein
MIVARALLSACSRTRDETANARVTKVMLGINFPNGTTGLDPFPPSYKLSITLLSNPSPFDSIAIGCPWGSN